MAIGLFFVLASCLIWSVVFVIPGFLDDFSSTEIVLGRYAVYGILSSFIVFRTGISKTLSFPAAVWVKALLFSLVANIFCYFGIVGGVKFASAPLTVLIFGVSPVTIALYGNWKNREISFKELIFPCLGIISGLLLVNASEIKLDLISYSFEYFLGLLGIFTSLTTWTWYVVHNARFIKKNPHISSTEWTTLIGVCTLFWVIVLTIFLTLVLNKDLHLNKFIHWSYDTSRFVLGISILGIMCSWLAVFFWNKACSYMPVSLMGSLLIFEYIFGLILVYIVNSRVPSLMEITGIFLMLASIFLSMRIFRKKDA